MTKENPAKTNAIALSIGILTVAALRTIMAPYPNIEPVMLSTIATGLLFGPISGFLMGAGSMLVSQFFLAPGPLTFPWLAMMPLVTVYTTLTFGVVGAFAGLLGFFKRRWGRIGLAALAAGMTILYDLVTAVCFALQFYGPGGISAALVAQIPFTVLHLSNAVFAFILAPYLLKWVYGARNVIFGGINTVKTTIF